MPATAAEALSADRGLSKHDATALSADAWAAELELALLQTVLTASRAQSKEAPLLLCQFALLLVTGKHPAGAEAVLHLL